MIFSLKEMENPQIYRYFFKNCTIPRRSCLVGGYLLLLVVYVLNRLLLLDIPYWDLWNICFINCIFLTGGLV